MGGDLLKFLKKKSNFQNAWYLSTFLLHRLDVLFYSGYELESVLHIWEFFFKEICEELKSSHSMVFKKEKYDNKYCFL